MTGLVDLKMKLFFSRTLICIFYFILCLFFISNSHALTLKNVDLCMHKDFYKSLDENGKLKKLGCSNVIREGAVLKLSEFKKLDDGTVLNSDDFNQLHAVVIVRNLREDAHKDLLLNWLYNKKSFPNERTAPDPNNTYYSQEYSDYLKDNHSKVLEAEAMYEDSKFGWMFAIVEVLFTPSRHFRTEAQKSIHPNDHLGEWEFEVLEKTVENKSYKILYNIKFTVVK